MKTFKRMFRKEDTRDDEFDSSCKVLASHSAKIPHSAGCKESSPTDRQDPAVGRWHDLSVSSMPAPICGILSIQTEDVAWVPSGGFQPKIGQDVAAECNLPPFSHGT